MKVLFFAKNYEKYLSGYYHDDILRAWKSFSEEFWVWGPGYQGYNQSLDLSEVIVKLCNSKPDLIVVGTSWDDDTSETNVNPNDRIKFNDSATPVIYYLNKEYKKLEQRFDYIRRNKFSHVITMNLNWREYQKSLGNTVKVIHSHFGYDRERFKPCDFIGRKWDFAFTGGLHSSHNDLRFLVKTEIFAENFISKKSNLNIFRQPIKARLNTEVRDLRVYWAEWGAKDWRLRSMLPFGEKYFEFIGDTKFILSTPSADGLINTRFFEALACGTIVICPRDHNYDGILKDRYNCIMYNEGGFVKTINELFKDSKLQRNIYENSLETAKKHTYYHRVKEIVKLIHLEEPKDKAK